MSKRRARFEIVHGFSGYWARYRAANGQIVWSTEQYASSRPAHRAIAALMAGASDATALEVREVDLRG